MALASPVTLPLEIIQRIVDYSLLPTSLKEGLWDTCSARNSAPAMFIPPERRRHLLSLAYACKSLYNWVCSRYLYAYIDLRRARQCHQLATSLHVRPALRGYVKSLVVHASKLDEKDLELLKLLPCFSHLERLCVDCSVTQLHSCLVQIMQDIDQAASNHGGSADVQFIYARINLSRDEPTRPVEPKLLYRRLDLRSRHAEASRYFQVYETDLSDLTLNEGAIKTWASNGSTALPAYDFDFLQHQPMPLRTPASQFQLHLSSRFTHRFSLRAQPDATRQQITHLRLEHPCSVSLDMNAAERDFAIIQDIAAVCPNLIQCSIRAYNLASNLSAVLRSLPASLETLVLEDCHLGSWEGGLRILTERLKETQTCLPKLQSLWVDVEDAAVLTSRLQHISSPEQNQTPEPASLETLHAACRKRGIDPFNPVPWLWDKSTLTDRSLIPSLPGIILS